ncbi:MAG: peroxiredoxin family protein, partial [Anaerolineales bacterium]
EIAEAARAEPAEGFLAPDFTLETLAGDQVTLSGLRGQVVLVNLWASWCGPCRAEMPAIQQIYEQYRDRGFTVLGVNLTNQDSRAAAQAFVDEFGLTFPILLDTDGSVAAAYRLRSLPSSYFIDRNGVIQKVVLGGPMAEALVQTQVEQLLGLTP